MTLGRSGLRLAVAQFDAAAGDVDRNIGCHLDLLSQAADRGAALVVFPELSITGYCGRLLDQGVEAQMVEPKGERLDPIRKVCAERGIAALVGAPTRGETGAHLSAIMIGRDGDTELVYDKMYLDEDERQWFVRGTTPRPITIDGWVLGVGICYDSSFPEHARLYAIAGADAYLLPGAFPLGRSDYRRTIYFPARALENTIYLAFANYVGSHDGLEYGGMSAVYGPEGESLADAGPEAPGLAVWDLDDTCLAETRARLKMLEDRL